MKDVKRTRAHSHARTHARTQTSTALFLFSPPKIKKNMKRVVYETYTSEHAKLTHHIKYIKNHNDYQLYYSISPGTHKQVEVKI